MTKSYPGKPGPKSTGVKRKILFPLALSEDEYEYISRWARTTQPMRKVGPHIRASLFSSGWRGRLQQLRKKQGANIK